MPTSSERGPAEQHYPANHMNTNNNNHDFNDLRVTVMTQIEKIKQLEDVLQELRGGIKNNGGHGLARNGSVRS